MSRDLITSVENATNPDYLKTVAARSDCTDEIRLAILENWRTDDDVLKKVLEDIEDTSINTINRLHNLKQDSRFCQIEPIPFFDLLRKKIKGLQDSSPSFFAECTRIFSRVEQEKFVRERKTLIAEFFKTAPRARHVDPTAGFVAPHNSNDSSPCLTPPAEFSGSPSEQTSNSVSEANSSALRSPAAPASPLLQGHAP